MEMAGIVVEATGSSSGLNECIDLVKKKVRLLFWAYPRWACTNKSK